MKRNLIYVQRAEDQSKETWVQFCAAQNRSIKEIYGAYMREDGFIDMADKPMGKTWIFNTGHFIEIKKQDVVEININEPEPKDNAIRPNHYMLLDLPTIEMIARALTVEQWRGFCLGNILKYRIRAGKKDDLVQDIDKANNYEHLYENLKHLCRKDRQNEG